MSGSAHRLFAAVCTVVAAVTVLTGCDAGYRVGVSPLFIDSPLTADLAESLVTTGIPRRRVTIEAYDAATPGEIVVLDGNGEAAQRIVLTDDGLVSAVTAAVGELASITVVEDIFLVVSSDRSGLCSDVTEALPGGEPGVTCIQEPVDSTPQAFADVVARRIDIERSGMVLIAGDLTPAILRRLGTTDGPERWFVESVFPAGGRRYRAAGYPVGGAISSDVGTIFADSDDPAAPPPTVYVPMRLFRY